MIGKSRGLAAQLALFLGFVAMPCISLAAQTSTSSSRMPPALSEKAQRGKAVFTDRCFVCHDVDSERVPRLGPPPLESLFKKEKLINGKPVNEANVTEMIKFGPTPNMPAFQYTLTDSQISDVVEYLKRKEVIGQ